MQLNRKLQNYYTRNERFSPIHQMQYQFIKSLYWYLIGFLKGEDTREDLYKYYIQIVNWGYFPNKAEIPEATYDFISNLSNIIITSEAYNEYSMFTLNNSTHIKIMRNVLSSLIEASRKEQYLNKEDFIYIIDRYRGMINEHKIDLFEESGKIPQKRKRRFEREPKHNRNINKTTKLQDSYTYKTKDIK